MLRIQQVKLPIDHNQEDLYIKAAESLKVKREEIKSLTIFRKSIDARKKDEILFIYALDVDLYNDIKISKRNANVTVVEPFTYEIEATGEELLNNRPVVVGSGPAGLFCALLLAEKGYRPIILERGKKVKERVKDIERFWKDGTLRERSNIQFGEGGAGTFSDGKLNTLIKDRSRRGKKVLEEFVDAGAPDEITYLNKPHIGTDLLRGVIVNIRKKIISLGGTFRFEEQLTDIKVKDGNVCRIVTESDIIETDVLVLAIGHSARDTFEMLSDKVELKAKPFAMGVRIEHPQKMISEAQYGSMAGHPNLGPADYKFVHKSKNGRSVYTFCMCPGGVVTASSSEEGYVVTNGMSFHDRDLENANAAIVVQINPEDFGGEENPLAGIEFQRRYEKKAFELGGSNYHAPVQLFRDFKEKRVSSSFGEVYPTYRPGATFANLWDCLPDYVCESLVEGIAAFGKWLENFDRDDAVLTGVETRTSSPLRIDRNDELQSNVKGIYPCGEGSGYAGGIMSAAIDGLKVAEQIIKTYKPMI
ncbi:FAD-dependent protein [Sedimentibacter sp.]|uniref:NAD(P)/FAD-dependent oxidoreductase n=1 Tax=Sedimentibacter sp. TaxID=1960295 RepID=UPI0028A1A620|nr:NAD(P)-binding protein [Sedimentibacter sp.]